MPMRDFLATVAAEIRALGWRCFGFGPEAWLVFPLVCLVGFVIGFLIFYHWGDNND